MRKIAQYFILLLITANGCRQFSPAEKKNVFRYNESANITSLDPAFARDQANIWAVNQIFNGLVQLDDQLEIRPCIASGWDISQDGRIYTFHLRQDICFQDDVCFPDGKGRRVRARDLVYSFSRITSSSVASPGSWIFNQVDTAGGKYKFTARDDSTFVICLRQPFPPFLGLLAMPYCAAVPEEAVMYYGTEFRNHPVGTGPFRFKFWKEGVKLVLLKNHTYFEFQEGERLPYLDGVSITFLADRQSAFLEFMQGKLDLISGIDPAYKDELLTRSGTLKPSWKGKIKLITQSYLNTEYLGILMDTTVEAVRESPLRNKKIRQSINYCFDRQKMIRYLRNNIGTPGTCGIVPAGMPGFDSSRAFYSYDPARASALLAEAGFPGGQGLAPITLVSTPDYLDMCKYIQHEASLIGIDLRIEINPPAAVKEMKATARIPFFRASWIADYPDAENYLSLFYSRNFCPQGPNYTRYSNTEFDRLYEQSLSLTDDSLRYSLYRKMEKILMNDSPVVILYYDQVLRFVRNNIEGLGSNAMNLLSLKKVRKK